MCGEHAGVRKAFEHRNSICGGVFEEPQTLAKLKLEHLLQSRDDAIKGQRACQGEGCILSGGPESGGPERKRHQTAAREQQTTGNKQQDTKR
jgi:hypothetical protein